jgi:hypothetical protein
MYPVIVHPGDQIVFPVIPRPLSPKNYQPYYTLSYVRPAPLVFFSRFFPENEPVMYLYDDRATNLQIKFETRLLYISHGTQKKLGIPILIRATHMFTGIAFCTDPNAFQSFQAAFKVQNLLVWHGIVAHPSPSSSGVACPQLTNTLLKHLATTYHRIYNSFRFLK